MSRHVRDDIVQRFGVSPREAEELIAQHEGQVLIRKALAAAQRGEVVRANPTPELELRRRRYAVGVLKQGVAALTAMRDHIDEMIAAEKRLINQKIDAATNHRDEWWDMRGSGWSAGGREHFAHCLCDVLQNIDETTLGRSVRGRMGFNRTIVIPEELQDPPVVPEKSRLEASSSDRLAVFEAAMMRVGDQPGVVVVSDDPWKFRFNQRGGVVAQVQLRDTTMTVTALNHHDGREPREYRVARPTAAGLVRLVGQAVREMS